MIKLVLVRHGQSAWNLENRFTGWTDVELSEQGIKEAKEAGKRVIIAAHGNSLRGLIKYLDNMTDEEIIKLELRTGNPICYELDDNLKPITHYYLK